MRNVETECSFCGRRFLGSVKSHGGAIQKFCSHSCSSKSYHHPKRTEHKCGVCGKRFFRAVSLFRKCKNTYCGTICAGKAKRGKRTKRFTERVSLLCDNCERPLEKPRWLVRNKNYCDPKCSAAGRILNARSHPFGYSVYYKGIRFRSTWEVRIAKWLNDRGVAWDYEAKSFKVGDGFYIPDFWIESFGCYWEIKGWLTDKAERKIKTFRETYPEIPLVVVDGKMLRAMGISIYKNLPVG